MKTWNKLITVFNLIFSNLETKVQSRRRREIRERKKDRVTNFIYETLLKLSLLTFLSFTPFSLLSLSFSLSSWFLPQLSLSFFVFCFSFFISHEREKKFLRFNFFFSSLFFSLQLFAFFPSQSSTYLCIYVSLWLFDCLPVNIYSSMINLSSSSICFGINIV